MATYCIICGKPRKGLPIKTDYVIEAIRWFKRNVTKDEKGNSLVVCKECYPIYKKRHDKYRSRQALYIAIGALFVIFTLILSFSLQALVVSVVVLLVLYLMSLLSYTPELNVTPPEGHKTGKQKQ